MLTFLLAIICLNSLLFIQEQRKKNGHIADSYGKTVKELYEDYNRIMEPYKGIASDKVKEKFEQDYKINQQSAYEKLLYEWLYDQITYLEEYPNYLNTIQKQAENLSQISIFQEVDSFSQKNLKKTANDFSLMNKFGLEVGENEGIVAFLDFSLSDYLVIIIGMAVVYQLLAERKKGLWEIVHSTKYGRLRLSVRRLIIVLFCAVLSSLFIYGINLMLSLYIYGGADGLHRAVQSMKLFKLYNSTSSILEFLMHYFLIKIVAIFLIYLCIWLVLSAVKTLSLSFLFMGGVAAIEYIAYTFLPLQSHFNVVKYMNLFSYIHLPEIYTNYLNVSLFGNLKSTREIALEILPVLILVISSCCLLTNTKKKPKESSIILRSLLDYFEIFSNKITSRLNLILAEVYKILIIQKGILILLILVYIQYNSISNINVYYSRPQLYLNSYYEKIHGAYSEEMVEVVEELGNELREKEKEVEELVTLYGDGKINFEEYYNRSRAYEDLGSKAEAYEMLHEKIEKAEQIKVAKGINVWIFNDLGYERMMGNTTYSAQQVQALKAVFFMVLILSSVFVYERQAGTFDMIRATKKGRLCLFRKKMQASFLITTIVWLLIYGVEILNTYRVYGLDNLAAPIQSVSSFSDFDFSISLGGFLACLYMIRLIVMQCVAYMIVFFSSVAERLEYSILGSTIVLLTPSALVIAGINIFKYIAIIVPIGAVEWYQGNQNILAKVSPFVIILAFGILFRICCRKVWNNEKYGL